MNVAFAHPSPLYYAARFLDILGCLAVCAFLVIEETTASYWRHYRDRAAALERSLGTHRTPACRSANG